MIDLEALLTFEVDTKSMIIKNSNNKEIVGMSFALFFKENFCEKCIGDIVERFDYDYLVSILNAKKEESFIFHVKNYPIYYHFIVTTKSENVVQCIFEKKFISNTLNVINNLDYLSGVYSRSYLISCIQNSLLDADTKDFYFFIIDINNFKTINDKFGHRVGDEALRKFAQTLLKIRGENIFGRYGGDEFILFCPNISKDEATELARKILNISFTVDEDNTKLQVTCCVGLAYSNDKNSTFDFLLERADKALYKSKEMGKHIAFLNDEIIAKSSKTKIRSINQNSKKLEKNSILYSKEAKIRKFKYISLIALIVICCVSLTLLLGSIIRKYIDEDTKKETKNSVQIVSSQIESKLKSNIESWIAELNIISEALSNKSGISDYRYEQLGDFLYNYKLDVVFSDLAVATNFDGAENLCFMDREDGSPYITSIRDQQVYNDLINAKNDTDKKVKYLMNYDKYTSEENQIIFAVPFYDLTPSANSGIVGLCGIIDNEKFNSFLATDVFEKSSVVSLADKSGLVYGTTRKIPDESNNFLTCMESHLGVQSPEVISVKQALETGKSDIILLNIDNQEKYAYINHIDFTDNQSSDNEFRLIFTVPTANVMSNMIKTVNRVYVIVCFIIGASMLAVSIVIIFNYRHKSNFFVLNNIDSRTKGLNFNRFKKDTQSLILSGDRFSYVYVNCINYTMMFQNEEEKRDELLNYINSLIESFLNEKELVSRVYIDKFIFTVKNDADHRNRISKIIEAINNGVYNKFNEQIKATAGVYENRLIDNSNIEYCIDMARLALQKALELNRENAVVYFNDRMLMSSIKNQSMKNKANIALSKGEFVVYYQAQRDIVNDVWYSSEALVRWKDPIDGLIFPDAFIPLFEREGLICDLDLNVFDQVCKFIQDSKDNNKRVLPVSLNISGKHLEKRNFLDDYYKILSNYDFDHSLIMFELTETVMVENKEIIKQMLAEIHKMGCGCAIDDFGVGYSSFSLITQFDFDEIKLDRSFFNFENEIDEKGKLVISSIVKLCKKLKIKVVAEGIEKASNIAYLKKVGCDVVQGYYFSKPIPQEEFEKLISCDKFSSSITEKK